MAKRNAKGSGLTTHEGAPAQKLSPEQALRRSVMACFLWEDEFYEDGESIATRISKLAAKVPMQTLVEIIQEAKHRHHLRHAPLWLLCALTKHHKGAVVGDTIANTIGRADEIPELLRLYWGHTDRRHAHPISKQMKRGLAAAFNKFDDYQIAKYYREGDGITLRDAMFLVHPIPHKDDTFKKLASKELESPDTWEVALSGGEDPKETWTRLLTEGRLGYMALLRNLRNMEKVGVDRNLVEKAILARQGADRVLPFRFLAAAKAAPIYEPPLEQACLANMGNGVVFPGDTIILVDVSGSMTWPLSKRSDMNRMMAAGMLASMIGGRRRVFSFSGDVVEVPPRMGISGVDAISDSQQHGGTMLGKAVEKVSKLKHDRLIVVTDEQSGDRVPAPVVDKAYMINVASAQNGVGYGPWVHINGFSENALKYITEVEGESLV